MIRILGQTKMTFLAKHSLISSSSKTKIYLRDGFDSKVRTLTRNGKEVFI